jgi:hypothetical protein
VESRKRIVIARVARMLVRVGVVVIGVSEHRLPAAPFFESIGVPSLRRRELGLSSPLRFLIRNVRPEVTCLPPKQKVESADTTEPRFGLP